MEYLIGDFSKISRISVKTLRYYHEIDLLNPSSMNSENGYRIYDNDCLNKARRISLLKELNFSLKEIKVIIEKYEDDDDLTKLIEQKIHETKTKIKEYKHVKKALEEILLNQKNVSINDDSIIIKTIPDMLIASLRVKDQYSSNGLYLGKIANQYARYICGKPFTLYYDSEYKENDVDMEICFPVKKQVYTSDIKTRILRGEKVISTFNKGQYNTVGNAYKILLDYLDENNIKTIMPSREIYIKGPSMIFTGNPKGYITEVQMIIKK